MSVSSAIEIERKYAVAEHTAVPALATVPGVVSAEARPAVLLEAVYVDTAERTLLGADIAVRRRTGGHDDGWHVKLRGAVGRTELHAPIDEAAPDAVPEAFEAALRSRLRGRPLRPIARITTERHAVLVTDGNGGAVEVVDDHVTASDVDAGVLRAWREWEAEQAEDTAACAALLERVHAALLAAGATPSESPAKIAQALGLVGAAPAPEPPRTAGAVVVRLVVGHAEALHRDIQSLVLDGDPDGSVVHAMRRTIRQVRSLLALRAVAGPAGARLRERVGEVGRLLGAARDPLVAAGVAEGLLEDLEPGTPGLDAAGALLVEEPRAAAATATAALVQRLGDPEVLAVLADLERFDPDGSLVAAKPKAMTELAERTVRRARRRARQGVRGDTGDLHRARKAAKRARFVVEQLAAAGVLPPRSALLDAAKRDERAQDVLGDHRDLALVLESLPAASERLTAAGSNAFAVGRVAELGEQRLSRLRRDVERAVRRLG